MSITNAEDATLKLVQREVVDSKISIELRQSNSEAHFVLIGFSDPIQLNALRHEEIAKFFCAKVFHPFDTSPTPPLLGVYRIDKNELQFISRFPLSPNVQYLVEFNPSEWAKTNKSQSWTGKDAQPREFVFSPLKSELAPPAKVVGIYPSANQLPENVLKFYIHFSAPMSRGEAYERIHLFCDDKEVDAPFLELGEELWDAEQTRFTLFIHPGRIKKGVKPREEDGLPIAHGKDYQLVIDQDWKSADRQKLQSRFVKSFRAIEADDEQPDPTKWKLSTPKLNTVDPVTITLNEPMDHAMLHRVLVVKDDSGNRIAGSTQVADNETLFRFVPDQNWKKGDYAIEVETNLEDLAGNSLARPFESKLRTNSVGVETAARIAIQFTVE